MSIVNNAICTIADNIIDYCYGTSTERVQRALIGITVNATDSKAVYNYETQTIRIQETVSVYEISKGSLAEGVLQKGDILLSATITGARTEITRQYHAIDMMLDLRVGDTVTFEILRDGEAGTVEITITEECLTAY